MTEGQVHRHLLGKNQGSYDLRTVDMDGDRDLGVLIAGHHNANFVWFENPLAVSPKPFPESSLLEGFDMNEFKLGNRSCRSFSLKGGSGSPLDMAGPFLGSRTPNGFGSP